MSQEQDKIFFRNFSLTLALIAAMMVAFYFAASAAVESNFGLVTEEIAADTDADVIDLTRPVGQVATVDMESESIVDQNIVVADVDNNSDDGESVYNGLCVNCHGIAALAAMIPQAGDAAVWGARIEKGIDVLYANAINGYTGELGLMPAKGGNPALSDDEVKAAVDYIINKIK